MAAQGGPIGGAIGQSLPRRSAIARRAKGVGGASSGKRRATTPTPTTQRIPPDTTANCGLVSAATSGRLDVAEARPARDDERVDRHDPAAETVGRLELDERGAEDRREDVRGAGERQDRRAPAGTTRSPARTR